ncbi:MAG: CDP-diacylglycerol--glycerol-3-phosphate 3-phosphatidyltransferase [Gemmatimonadota bacterium]|nr:MAG: CDP-diacylglycerol--glycerol-3-phosphate 3-phosphatidyltransferase [Gemmatimonadota bacterium]
MAWSRLNLPNTITIGRIAACPAIFLLALAPSIGSQIAAFVLFLVAAFSDLWDGYLARKHGLITDVGKLLDPLADKLLLVATFVPFYMISHRPGPAGLIPWWTVLPLWVMIVVLGREFVVTLFRQWAVRREVVIAAGTAGKYKAFVQNLFSGGLLLWYPLQSMARDVGWNSVLWRAFTAVHATWVGLTLGVAIILTVYSMIDYFWSYRALIGVRG